MRFVAIDLDLVARLEAVERLSSSSMVRCTSESPPDSPSCRAADRVDLVHEDDGGGVLARHHEQLAHLFLRGCRVCGEESAREYKGVR